MAVPVRVPAHALRALAACIGLALLAAPPAAAKDAKATLNLLWAEDDGCTPDTYSPADLQVTVRLDGEVVLQAYAPQQDRPEFAAAVQVPWPAQPQRLTIRVEEAEPTGFLGLGTDFVNCDAAQGDEADVHGMDWDGSTVAVDARGDTGNSVRVRLKAGDGAPAVPKPRIDGITPAGATISWDADPAGRATGHRVAAGAYGPQLRVAGSGAGSEAFTDLCDGMPYSLRVIRDGDGWSIQSKDIEFETGNLPPAEPRIVKATPGTGNASRSVQMEWEEATPHDIDHYDLHAGGSPAFAPSLENKVGTGHVTATRDVRGTASIKGGETHVKVVAVDKGGLTATSPAFRIGDPETEPRISGVEDCGAIRDADAASQAQGQGGGGGRGSPAPALALVLAALLAAVALRRLRD